MCQRTAHGGSDPLPPHFSGAAAASGQMSSGGREDGTGVTAQARERAGMSDQAHMNLHVSIDPPPDWELSRYAAFLVRMEVAGCVWYFLEEATLT